MASEVFFQQLFRDIDIGDMFSYTWALLLGISSTSEL
jgi:hypothetical protein